MLLPLHLKRKLLNKAKRMAPEDTGNLRFNAIKGLKWTSNNKFTIRYDESTAPYVEVLQDSTWNGKAIKRKNIHKGFIDRTVLEIINDLNNFYSGKRSKGKFSELKDNGDLRQLQRRISVYQRSEKLNDLKREVYANDQPRSVKEFNI